ncbi:hypothetical protein D3229_12575 [Leucobacter aridicollis]|nr:hypothetical protein [Leucobacter aridicollis]
MHSLSILTVGPNHEGVGAPSLVQGVYGAVGNLELLSCDREDGLWVYWFNSDRESDPCETPDVPAGTWSAGLHFASGAAYAEAQIMQSSEGPNHLEVLALTRAGALESWFWSPGPGFQRRGTPAWSRDGADRVEAFNAVISGGQVSVTVRTSHGTLRRLHSDTTRYPERHWEASATGPGLTDGWADLAKLRLVEPAEAIPSTAREASSTREGGMREVTWRGADGRVRHWGLPLREEN